MTHTTEATLHRTPLHDRHLALGARMMPFAGWEMPVEYSGITEEHLAVRQQAGLFDVSHMGEIEVAGDDAPAAVDRLTSNDVAGLDVGHAQYAALTTHEGTFVDDLLVYRLADAHFLLVVNAANVAKDMAWIRQETASGGDVVAVNASSRYAMLAVQGPRAIEALQPLTGIDLAAVPGFAFDYGEVAGVLATVSRTGYTGEDGFELFVPPASAGRVWDALLASGEPHGLRPAGLGARDTLRLEAALRLYGHEIDETTTVLEAGLGWAVAWDKPAFNGKAPLAAQKAQGLSRKLVGFEMAERGIGRHGYAVRIDGTAAGRVTSGTRTPFLKKAIGMAYVPITASAPGTEIAIDVRGRPVAARVVKLPFYRRATS